MLILALLNGIFRSVQSGLDQNRTRYLNAKKKTYVHSCSIEYWLLFHLSILLPNSFMNCLEEILLGQLQLLCLVRFMIYLFHVAVIELLFLISFILVLLHGIITALILFVVSVYFDQIALSLFLHHFLIVIFLFGLHDT